MLKVKQWLPWFLAAFDSLVVFAPSLIFKFTGAIKSRHIFQTAGQFLGFGYFEPYGRYRVAVAELATAVMLLVPRTPVYGAGIALGVLSGAIFFHLASPLGITVRWIENGMFQEDGTLFSLAVLS